MGTMPVGPPPQMDDGTVNDVPRTGKERVLGGVGGVLSSLGGHDPNTSPLARTIADQHGKRLAEAQLHQKNMSTYGGILAAGMNPETNQPLTDDERTKFTHWYNMSKEGYTKALGGSKEGKEMANKHVQAADTIIALHPKPGGQGPQPPPTMAGPAAGTPTSGGTDPSAPGAGGAGVPPPPKADSASSAAATPAQDAPGPDPRMEGGRLRGVMAQRQADARDLAQYKAKEGALYDLKVKEDAAKVQAQIAAKAATPSTARVVFGPATSVRNARLLATQGKSYLDAEGNAIDLTSMPDGMGLKYVAQGGKHWYEEYSPNSKVLTVGKETYAINPMDVEAAKDGAGTDLGAASVPTTRRTTDPVTGQTTVSTSTPQVSGIKGRGGATAAAAPRGANRIAQPPQNQAGAPAPAPTASATQSEDISDKEGTPQIVAAAKQLIAGHDLDKLPLPTKGKELAAQLAEKHGWSPQGLFNPAARMQLDQSTHFINKFADSDSLSVLDSMGSRLKIGQVLAASAGHSQGGIGRVASTLASKGMTPKEAEFVRLYNQTVQTIAGLRQITSPGKSTEAAINRLLADLPNPASSQGSKDARQRLGLLQEEIKIAKESRSWNHLLGAGGGGAGAKAGSVDDEIMKLVGAAGKP